MAKQTCSKCGSDYSPQWWDRGLCLSCDQDAAYEQLQAIRSMDGGVGKSADRPGWLVADPKRRGQG